MDVTNLVYIDSAGYHYADFPTWFAWLTGKYRAIYGEDVYLGSDSQDGQYLGVVAQALYDTAAFGASVYSSFSPSTAQGTGLSRNVKINGLRRLVPSNSTAELVLVGQAFTTLTNAQAYDANGNLWSIPSPTTIPFSGTITVTATCLTPGAVTAPLDTINGIQTPTRGWQTVNNPAAATSGAPVESDATLRNRQSFSTSLPAQTVLDATVGAVSNVPGVIALRPYENYTDTTDSNGLPPHSISLVVEGGLDADVAKAIQLKKTPGTNTYGTTNVPTTDSKGVPITINFFRATNAEIGVEVTLTPGPAWISSNTDIIAGALSAFIQATKIGGSIILTQLYAIAYVPGTTAAGSFIIEGIRLKKNAGSFAAADIDLLFNEDAICNPSTDVSFIEL